MIAFCIPTHMHTHTHPHTHYNRAASVFAEPSEHTPKVRDKNKKASINTETVVNIFTLSPVFIVLAPLQRGMDANIFPL